MKGTVVFVDTGISSIVGGEHQSRLGREEIGAQLVAACCQEVGWNVRYIRPNSKKIEHAVSMVKEGIYDVLVFFPYTYTKWLADKIAQEFKGDVPIVYGGYHSGVGMIPHKILREGIADFVIAGRGEEAFPHLLQQLAAGDKPHKILRGHSLGNKKNYPLDYLPWPIRQDSLMQDILTEPLPFNPPHKLEPYPRKCILVAGSIGCNARCDFCSSWLISPKSLLRSPGNVVDEMVYLQKQFGQGLVYTIVNPLFNADRAWVMDLCTEMEHRGPFPTICTPDFCLDREMAKAMKRAGIYMVMMGLEFADNDIRISRGKRNGDPIAAYHACAEEGIITRAYFMLGRLGMTRADLYLEINRINALPFRADQLRINFEVPFPGTKISKKITSKDIILDESHWTTEEVVYRTGINPLEWQESRRRIMWNYHFSDQQQRHYETQIAKHPELQDVYEDFISIMKINLAA